MTPRITVQSTTASTAKGAREVGRKFFESFPDVQEILVRYLRDGGRFASVRMTR